MNIKKTALYAESWNIAFRKTNKGEILVNKNDIFTIIPNSFRYWAADPMIYEHEGKTMIFAELYDYINRKGIIGVSIYDGYKFGNWKPVIEEKFHMSYPFVFKMNDDIYMLPETSEAKQLRLYKAVDFPYKWKLDKIIKNDVRWVDTTLLISDTQIIGYTEDLEKKNDMLLEFDEELNIKREIVQSDFEWNLNRSGGPFLIDSDENIVRVSQDCVKDYGTGLIFTKLKDNGNSIRITPDMLKFDKAVYINGMHTYSTSVDMEIIDIKTRRFNPLNFVFRIINKIKNRFRKRIII